MRPLMPQTGRSRFRDTARCVTAFGATTTPRWLLLVIALCLARRTRRLDLEPRPAQRSPPRSVDVATAPARVNPGAPRADAAAERPPRSVVDGTAPRPPATAPAGVGLDAPPAPFTAAPARRQPRFVFGHSTGHSGSTSLHAVLKAGCYESRTSKFEMTAMADNVSETWWGVDYPRCANTTRYLLPKIKKRIKKRVRVVDEDAVFIDMGHMHNRARVIECLAAILGEDAAFVRIRRDRYAIARSFASKIETPCLKEKQSTAGDWLKHPRVSLCPRSDEGDGPVNLPVPDDAIWDGLTPFQRFLWYADEMEHRWHALRAAHEGRVRVGDSAGQPQFLEATWASKEEFEAAGQELQTTLRCKALKLPHRSPHAVAHGRGNRTCATDVRQDLEYRRLMGYNESILRILVSEQFPQHVDSEECSETPRELTQLARSYAVEQGMPFVAEEWVFPEVLETSNEGKASKASEKSKRQQRQSKSK